MWCKNKWQSKQLGIFKNKNKTPKKQMEIQEKIIIEIRNAMDRLNNMW